MRIEKTSRMGLLYDYYGQLFTDKQQMIFELYYENDLSLGEIGDEIGISRQAVHDSLKKTEALLEDYETKMALCNDSKRRDELIQKAFRELENGCDKNKLEAYLREIGD